MDLRLVHIVPFFGASAQYGGMDRAAQGICSALAERGVSVTVLTTDYGVKIAASRSEGGGGLKAGVTVRRSRSMLEELNDIVELYIVRGFRKLCRDHVMSADIVHFHGARSFENLVGGRIVMGMRKPYVVQPHGSMSPSLSKTLLKNLYDKGFGRRHFRNSSAMIATSTSERKSLELFEIPPDKIALIPNGVDRSYWAMSDAQEPNFRTEYSIAEDAPLVLFVGRLDFTKGLNNLVRAFAESAARIPSARLVLIGQDFGSETVVRNISRALGVEKRINILGALRRDDIRRAFQTATVTVLPSKSESFGLAALEAAAAGCPVIVSNSIGVAPYFEAIDGMVIEPDKSALVEMLDMILSDERFRKLEQSKLDLMRWSDFAWPTIASSLVHLYAEILSRQDTPQLT